jgi:hypothetical protein
MGDCKSFLALPLWPVSPWIFGSLSFEICNSNESIDFVHGKSKFFIEVLDELDFFIDKK